MALHPRNLAILAALALAGCGGIPSMSLPDVKARNDFKGKPVSVIVARLGNPDFQQTISGQKFFMWRIGTSTQNCLIAAGISGDVVDSYNATGDVAMCSPYLPPAEPVQAQ
ncbi:hypothetical protein [Bradyrhizobium sp.]|uniref:hypothetical protein n=1 Tax=Bradyrhizobium sp. TaxID=376 RepID=UPI00260CDDE6|nr:hypothetical protein [Bradyrhizobium sp.]